MSTAEFTPPTAPLSVQPPPSRRARLEAYALADGPAHLALLVVLAGSALLEIHRLGRNGWANIFYSAGVRSDLHSLHNFFFVSFDPGGLVSVDKPPLGVWWQVLWAKLFGFHPLSLLLPEALATVASVLVLFRLVSRRFGPWTGVLAAAALAVFPSLVAVSRDNNVDALLILFMLLACAAGIRAAETGRLRSLVLCAAWVGLAFNTKTLAAYLILPGLAAAYLVTAPGSVRRRLVHLAVAGLVAAAVSVVWLAAVDLTPASQRPFVGSTDDNSEFSLAFSYNGVGRVGGQVGGPGQILRAVRTPQGGVRILVIPAPGGRTRTARGGPVPFGGPTGPLRLFGHGLGDQGGWILPFALVGLLATALTIRRRQDRAVAPLLVMGAWFLAELAVLDFGKGIIHPYYVSALGPGTAAAAAMGVHSMATLARRGVLWRLLLPLLAAAGTVAAEIHIMRGVRFHSSAGLVLALAAAVLVLAAVLLRRFAGPAIGALLALLLVVPAAYSATVWDGPVNGTFPAAGARNARTDVPHGAGRTSTGASIALLSFLHQRVATMHWQLLAQDSLNAAPLILAGERVAAIGGYNGADPSLSPQALARLVSAGQARFVEIGGAFASRGGNATTLAVQQVCTLVPPGRWGGPRSARNSLQRARAGFVERGLSLFDCRGHAPQLAARPGF